MSVLYGILEAEAAQQFQAQVVGAKKAFSVQNAEAKSHPVQVVGAEKGLPAQVLGADLGPYRCPTLQD